MSEESEAMFWQLVRKAESGDAASMIQLGLWLLRLADCESQAPPGIRKEAARWILRSEERDQNTEDSEI